MYRFAIVLFVLLLEGCSALPLSSASSMSWVSINEVDELTDTWKCIITLGRQYTQNITYTHPVHYYPYVEISNLGFSVGIKSGGRFKIPVGDVRIQIDSNETWNISTSETPMSYMFENHIDRIKKAIKNNNLENSEVAQDAKLEILEAMAKTKFPYTATTGTKAVAIFKEMQVGKQIKYWTTGPNQWGPTTGEYDIDKYFHQSVNRCHLGMVIPPHY